MFVDKRVCYTALFTNLVRWHTFAVSLTSIDVILAQLACPLSDVMYCLHSRITNLSLYKHSLIGRVDGDCWLYFIRSGSNLN
jgi:hypothetical protein